MKSENKRVYFIEGHVVPQSEKVTAAVCSPVCSGSAQANQAVHLSGADASVSLLSREFFHRLAIGSHIIGEIRDLS